MKIAIPDIVSNSYFPTLAAVELGICRDEGLDIEIAHLFPVDRAFAALRDGAVDFVATTAHGALSAFPNWRGCKLLCAQSQGMYWFLVMRADLAVRRNDLSALHGKTIGAAPWAADGLKAILGPVSANIGAPALDVKPGVSFGIAMVEALRDRTIDGFWANGMAAELAVRSGAGTVVLDIRRGDGPPGAFRFTQPSLIVTNALIEKHPEQAAAMVRAMQRVHAALRADPGLATPIGVKLFPPAEAALIETLIRRDLPYYDSTISRHAVAGMVAFAQSLGQLSETPDLTSLVAMPGEFADR